MSRSRTSNALVNSAATLIYKGLHIILQFVLRTAFINLLGNEYTGISALFTDVLNVLSLMELGINSALLYALYKPLAEKDERRIAALMNFYKKAYRTIGIAILVVGAACTPFLDYIVKDIPSIKEDIRLIFLFYIGRTGSSYLLIYKSALLRADQRSRDIVKIDIVAQLIEYAVEIALLFVFHEYMAYLVVYLLSAVGRNIAVSALASKRYPQYLKKNNEQLSRQETKSIFADVFALGIYKVSGVVIYSTSSIVISSFVNTAAVAIVGNFTLITNSLRTLLEQIVNAVKPSVGNLVATSTSEKQEQIFGMMNFMLFWVSCFCCTCCFALMNPFVGTIWFNSEYAVGYDLIAILVLNLFIAIMVYPVETFRTANGLFVQGKYRPAVMAVLNIILSILFVQKMGAFGVFLATAVSRLVTQVWFDPYLVYKWVFKKSVWGYLKEYALYLVLTAACCGVTYLLNSCIALGNVYLTFLCQAVVAAVVPNVVVVLLFHRTRAFKQVLAMAKRIIGRKMPK